MLGFLLAISGLCAISSGYIFQPRTSPSLANDIYGHNVGVVYNISESMTPNGSLSASYWSSSFVRASDNSDYMILSHAIAKGAGSFYRASVLNITGAQSPNAYTQFLHYEEPGTLSNNTFSIIFPDAGFEALSTDSVSDLHTWSDNWAATFDLSFNSTGPILYNGGAGTFEWGPGLTNEWSMTSAKTSGSLKFNGQMLSIDADQSVTWFDRQWGTPLSNGNWTWFEVHLDGCETKLSIWAIDSTDPYQVNSFATIKYIDGSETVSQVTFEPDTSRTYVSSLTGITYPLAWTVAIPDGSVFHISSIRDDQEIVGNTILDTAYEGFISVNGIFRGKPIRGYGVVEMVRLN